MTLAGLSPVVGPEKSQKGEHRMFVLEHIRHLTNSQFDTPV